jgi:hypothetical protein
MRYIVQDNTGSYCYTYMRTYMRTYIHTYMRTYIDLETGTDVLERSDSELSNASTVDM